MAPLLFLVWLCAAAVWDFQYRRVPNWLVALGACAALLCWWLPGELRPWAPSWTQSLLGALGAFLVLLPFYLWRLMGAADVKFAAVLGLWLGWQSLLPIWAVSCGLALVHGLVVKAYRRYGGSWPASREGPAAQDGMASVKARSRFIPYVAYLAIASVLVLTTGA